MQRERQFRTHRNSSMSVPQSKFRDLLFGTSGQLSISSSSSLLPLLLHFLLARNQNSTAMRPAKRECHFRSISQSNQFGVLIHCVRSASKPRQREGQRRTRPRGSAQAFGGLCFRAIWSLSCRFSHFPRSQSGSIVWSEI